MSSQAGGSWFRNDLFVVDGIEFAVTADAAVYLEEESTPDRFVVAKTRSMVEEMASVVVELAPSRIVELGIFKGGSAALLATMAKPVKLTAVDMNSEPVTALKQFIARRGLSDVISPHYGVD